MDTLFTWVGFFGAWLLFGGPVYQAALELREQEIQREDLERMQAGVQSGPPVSPWWWLLPPVKLVLENRRGKAAREKLLESLDANELAGLVSYMNKATGWLMVGAGGLLIAAKETWELVEHQEWAGWTTFLIIVAMALVCATFVAARTRMVQQILDSKRQPASAAPQVSSTPAPSSTVTPSRPS